MSVLPISAKKVGRVAALNDVLGLESCDSWNLPSFHRQNWNDLASSRNQTRISLMLVPCMGL